MMAISSQASPAASAVADERSVSDLYALGAQGVGGLVAEGRSVLVGERKAHMIRDLPETLTYPLWALLAKMHSEDKTEAVCPECAQDKHHHCTGAAIDSDA